MDTPRSLETKGWRGLLAAAWMAVLLSGLVGLPDSAAAFQKTQVPCVTPDGWCLQFLSNEAIPVVRSLDFNLPGPGQVLVNFHGSLLCDFFGLEDDVAVVDLASQIVTTTEEVPSFNGPGGLRHAITLLLPPSLQQTSDTFNLASSRIIVYTTGGPQTIFFKITKLRMDSGTQCTVYNATFSVAYSLPGNPRPVVASFGDVPTNHPFFQFIEALKTSGITSGCQLSPPLFCPDQALTRGQMAVFLSTALGLHFAP
jgi:hypothetical protein